MIIYTITSLDWTINSIDLTLYFFHKFEKNQLRISHNLAVVNTKDFQSDNWEANEKTVGTLEWIEYINEQTYNYVNNIQPIVEPNRYKGTALTIKDFHNSGLQLRALCERVSDINKCLNKFNIDLFRDDKDNTFIKTLHTGVNNFEKNYIFISKKLHENKVVVSNVDENDTFVKDTFLISIHLFSIYPKYKQDNAYIGNLYPSENSEIIINYKQGDKSKSIMFFNDYIDDVTLIKPDKNKLYLNLDKINQQDLDMNSLERFVEKNFSEYSDEFKNSNGEYVDYTVDYSSDMYSAFEKLIKETFKNIDK